MPLLVIELVQKILELSIGEMDAKLFRGGIGGVVGFVDDELVKIGKDRGPKLGQLQMDKKETVVHDDHVGRVHLLTSLNEATGTFFAFFLTTEPRLALDGAPGFVGEWPRKLGASDDVSADEATDALKGFHVSLIGGDVTQLGVSVEAMLTEIVLSSFS